MSSSVPAALRERYAAAGQEHVFKWVDSGKVPEDQVPALLAQLEAMDLNLVADLFTETMRAAEAYKTAAGKPDIKLHELNLQLRTAAKLSPCEEVLKSGDVDPARAAALTALTLTAVAEGQLGALVLAGGQGTRLGFDKPKGQYDIGLPSHKTLFQLQAERIIRIKQLASEHTGKAMADIHLPWYIMTSPMTDADTREFVTAQKFFGLPEEDVMFFSQGTLPCLTEEGKIILETAGSVAQAPDGNGGIYRALHVAGVMADMEKRGVKGVHVFAVDNAICKVVDPVFLGYCLETDADVGSKVCPKTGPGEKVGVLCRRDGQFAVVEYSDIDDVSKNARNADGELTFNLGNLCIHYYSTDFLNTACHPDNLPREYHLARKQIPHAHPETGEPVSKSEIEGNNGVKLESFIFDVFPASKRMAAFQVARETEFSPVKNAPGNPEDSPDSARQLSDAMFRSWVEAAGAKVEGEGLCEVSPLASYGGENLAALKDQTLALPCIVCTAAEAEEKQDGVNYYVV